MFSVLFHTMDPGGEEMGGERLWKILCIGAFAALSALAFGVLMWGQKDQTTAAWGRSTPTVVIDPGHGGEDGGAVAGDGTVESAINLAVAQRLDAILALYGQPTRLLRNEDVSLHDPGCDTIREKKVSDIHNRVKMVEDTPDARLISIHQNCFPSSKYHGAQVFYAGGPLGQPWAALTQENLNACLDPGNDRAAAAISREIYLMNHITCPGILVECGFLSNPEERARLKDPDYQTALAAVVAGSYLQSVQMEGEILNAPQSETGVLLHPVWE